MTFLWVIFVWQYFIEIKIDRDEWEICMFIIKPF